MKRTRLIFENVQQIVGAEGLSVILLTDQERRRALAVVCDEPMTRQILLRVAGRNNARTFLPEALLQMLDGTYEMMIYGIHNGQYQVVLASEDYQHHARLRMSDAVLLSIISSIPLYIEESLMERQSVPFKEDAGGVAIPINAMETLQLKKALQRAVDEENYELASQLRDEIKRRDERE